MRPRVHRHLVGQITELVTELKNLPDHPILTDDYKQARQMMGDALSLAMKHEMRASTWIRRSIKVSPRDMFVYPPRTARNSAAKEWWGWRAAIRKARFYHGCARIFLTFDQEHIS